MTSDEEIERLLRYKNDSDYKVRKVQLECKHVDKVLKFYYPCHTNVGDLRWVCRVCGIIVGYPTKNEVWGFLGNDE